MRDRPGTGQRLRVGGAQGAVDGGGELVVEEPQRHPQIRLDRAGVQRGLQIRGVDARQGEQRAGAPDLRGLQDALLRDVPDDHRHVEPPRHRDAAGVRVVLHAHHGDAELAELDEDTRTDLAEPEQHHVPGQTAWRPAQGRGRAERTEGLQHPGDEQGQQHQSGDAREELDDLAGGRVADRRVAHREQVEQGQIGGVQRIVPGGEGRRHRQAQDGQADAQGGPAQPS